MPLERVKEGPKPDETQKETPKAGQEKTREEDSFKEVPAEKAREAEKLAGEMDQMIQRWCNGKEKTSRHFGGYDINFKIAGASRQIEFKKGEDSLVFTFFGADLFQMSCNQEFLSAYRGAKYSEDNKPRANGYDQLMMQKLQKFHKILKVEYEKNMDNF